MNLYVKIVDGAIEGHPYLEDNLKAVLQTETLSEEVLEQNGYKQVVPMQFGPGQVTTGERSFELKEDGKVYETIPVREMAQEEKLDMWIRRPRNHALLVSDWTQMPDAPLTSEKKAEWAAYRQQLRDMTITYADIQDPSTIVPPVEPTK
jgi:hypothetical protein